MNKPTLRQVIINQLRAALGQLESPPSTDDVTVCFDVAETTFEFDVEQLDQPSLLSTTDEA